jgi:threonine dehydratase
VNVYQEVLEAQRRIRPHIRETLLERSAHFSKLGAAEVYFKLENLQHTGSFKVRGALNKVLSLTDAQNACGVVTASSGNHGAAVAFALAKTGALGKVLVPRHASTAKVANIERLGAEVIFAGDDSAETELHARRYATENSFTYISPYNDAQVIGGQGTIAVELLRQLSPIDAVFVAIGGGGLISGIAGHFAETSPATRVYGVSPENSQVMIRSIAANEILDLPSEPTISDGTAGGVEPGAMTFELIRDHVDELVTVSEDEIRSAMREYMGSEHQMIEGAAGTAIAGYLQQRKALEGLNVVVIVCGANIALDVLKTVL